MGWKSLNMVRGSRGSRRSHHIPTMPTCVMISHTVITAEDKYNEITKLDALWNICYRFVV